MEISPSVMLWWKLLSGVAVFNVILLLLSYRWLHSKKKEWIPEIIKYRNIQFVLCAIFALGCGFRSILPRADVKRMVLYDHWISSVTIGRSVATIAELAFVAQWALLLYEISRFTKDGKISMLSKVIVPLIFIAEIFSWYACTTGNFLGTVIEESLWAITALIFLIGMALSLKYYGSKIKKFLLAGIFVSIGYVFYMIFVDISNYVTYWVSDQAAGKIYKSVGEGLHEVSTFWIYTRAYEDWQYAMIWMSLYFSVAVWFSMILVHAPRMDKMKE
ncbi:MAG: hypothetical protein ACI94Y_004535 [Maribacter sp.]|jgi:hypothetical protein